MFLTQTIISYRTHLLFRRREETWKAEDFARF